MVRELYPDVEIILKPKTVTKEYRTLFKNKRIRLLGSSDVYLGDLLNISTLNIGMGIVAPVTVALIMNKVGIYYETAGNYDSPLCKYEGELIFRDRNSLMTKIDRVLSGNNQVLDINLLKNYNVSDSNPVDILRSYVSTGNVDKRYIV
jgi:hypothetical protein|tara:strand:+ start:15555 stop:15998 length:444 start_codon:yes stop_codon:yes gene_type:complete